MNKKIFIVSIITLIIDQITKILVDIFIGDGSVVVVIPNLFSLTNVVNTGAAFSILEGKTTFLTILSLIVLFCLLKMTKDFKNNKKNILAFGLVIGGIFGNFGDRLFLGCVRDFIKCIIFGYDFPIFNIADCAIVVGVIILIWSIIRGEDKDGSRSKKSR